MLDPNVQKKGGFSAFAERDQARRDARAATVSPPSAAVPPVPDAPAVPDTPLPVAPSARPEKMLDRSQPPSD